MSSALSAGVSGLQAHQKMLDVAGNNLANVNTTGFKSGYVTFSDTLSQSIKGASAPSSQIGGINPQQIGTGVQIATIAKNMTQGGITSTGQDLDMAIDGSGFFVLSDGSESYYTRIGSFAVDADNYLIDPATGYRVQRIGGVGETEGFQTVGNNNIRMPYDTTIPPEPTTEFSISGNLAAGSNSQESTATQLVMKMGSPFTTLTGDAVTASTKLSETEQYNGGAWFGTETIDVSGFLRDGTAVTMPAMPVDDTTTIQDVMDFINNPASPFYGELTASFEDGQLYITADEAGYTKSDIKLEFNSAGGADVDFPNYFEVEIPGGNDVASTSITILDSQGGEHVVSVSFVRTDTPGEWDLILNSVTGDVNEMVDRRIEGIQFTDTGEFDGLDGLDLNGSTFKIDFAHDAGTVQTITVDLGTKGKQEGGVTQYASGGGDSTVVAEKANGCQPGTLTGISVDANGTIVGTFSNGAKEEIASVKLAVFQNPLGLESVGNGYYQSTVNSGEAVETIPMNNGAGTLQSKSLEGSNVDTAVEFVKLMEAQNGFQANARTIQVANEVLQELTNLIR